MVVSLQSPIGQAFSGKKTGEVVHFNQTTYPIHHLE
jgi:transcription elongation GreA/GreB family factor